MSILDFDDYKEEKEKKLDEKYVDIEGVERAKYVKRRKSGNKIRRFLSRVE